MSRGSGTRRSLDIARAGEQGLFNIEFETRDVTYWGPNEPFDVVYARFLLSHFPNPVT